MLTIRQRRQLGITYASILFAARELKESGDIDSTTSESEIAALVLGKLSAKDPAAYRASGLDLDAIMQLIESMLPIILQLIDLLS